MSKDQKTTMLPTLKSTGLESQFNLVTNNEISIIFPPYLNQSNN